MTMPWGSTEEPQIIETESQSFPVHVVSTDAKPNRSTATEFGRWRTVIVSNVQGPYSITPGAARLLNRSLRRKRARIIVNSGSGGTPQTTASQSQPLAGANFLYTNTTGAPQTLAAAQATFTTSVVVGNRKVSLQINDAAGRVIASVIDGTLIVASSTITIDAYQGATQTNAASGTTILPIPQNVVIPPNGTVQFLASGIDVADQWSNINLTFGATAQSANDGVIVGSREEITSGQPAVIGSLGGFLDIGTSIPYEAQAELWVCFPASNTGTVIVSVCDEVYASDPESYKEHQ